jgi:hypothetical protein
VAKDQAADVAGSAKDATAHVATVAKDDATHVATEAKDQARNVLDQARTELGEQAADQQQRVADGLRSLGSELGSMADGSQKPGIATDLAQQASAKVYEVADWLENRDPSSLLSEVRSFARSRPGTFLAIALGAGIAAGRLTRGLKDDSSSSTGTSSAPSGSAQTAATVDSDIDHATATAAVVPAVPVEPAATTTYPEEMLETPLSTGVYTDEVTYPGGERR